MSPWRLTVKLRGRTEAPALGAEGAQSPSARGAKQEAHHGPLQRLLGGINYLPSQVPLHHPAYPKLEGHPEPEQIKA